MTAIATPLDEKELYDAGRAARSRVPRSSQAEFAPPPGRDPLGILRRQHENRLPALIALRVERMSTSAFAFYRGTAAIQAADLAAAPTAGGDLVICGDAHISNFGIYRSPENSMVFDINDFDEAAVGPFEWDVKRMLTSVVLAGRSLGIDRSDLRSIVLSASAMYRNALGEALESSLYRRYFRVTSMADRRILSRDSERMIKHTLKESEKRTSERVASRTLVEGGEGLQFVEDPPVLTRLEPEIRVIVNQVFQAYRTTVPTNIALMLSQYTVLDVARRVVGVGSVGTRCFIIALGDATGDILILQLKEANASVVEEFGGIAPVAGYLDPVILAEHEGYRVVGCQRILQAVSDPFLGYLTAEGRSFYMRIFRNRNASFEIADMNATQFSEYAQSCAVVLGRAHARSPKAQFVAGYLGTGGAFVRAATEWAHTYAAQAEEDYATFVEAARAGHFA